MLSSELTTHRMAYLDGWRGVAIILVLIDHFLQPSFGHFGNLGVELFFILSGRLMADILFVRRFDLPTFFKRRFSRIYPALLIFCTSLIPVSMVAGHYGVSQRYLIHPVEYFSAVTFTINYVLIYFGFMSTFGHLWSLCVEEHAYVMLATLAYLSSRNVKTAIIWTLGVSFICMSSGILQWWFTHLEWFQIYWRTDVRLASIFVSVGLYLWARGKSMDGRLVVASLTLGLALHFWGQIWISDTLGTIFLSLGLAFIGDAPVFIRSALSWRPLAQVGIWSYSLYLWQQPFYKVAYRAPLWVTPIAILGAVIAGVISFYVFEQPIRRYLNREWARAEPAHA